MTDTALLREQITGSGLKMSFIAEKVGITYAGFLKKLNNETEFKATEIQKLCEVLNIGVDLKEQIFFATK